MVWEENMGRWNGPPTIQGQGWVENFGFGSFFGGEFYCGMHLVHIIIRPNTVFSSCGTHILYDPNKAHTLAILQ